MLREKAFININKFKVKMKTKFILGSLALAATFVGCSNEELGNVAANDYQSNMIELGENFMIGAADVEGVESRTHWDLVENNTKLRNFFAPVIATESNNTIGQTSVLAPTIGLCWLGQTPGTQVYTNYEFIHNGWLAEDMEEAVFDECFGKLLTGYTYDELNTTANTVGDEIFDTNVTLPTPNKKYEGETLDAINWNSGVFKTENKSIFGGDYIAYYPFDASFINAGTIPAKSKVEFEVVENNLTSMDIAENTFRYTNVATIDGGAKASGFSFNNLSGIVRVSLQNIGGSNSVNVEKIVLYSESEGFLKEVRLSASAIAAGKKGAELYSEVVAKSNNVILNVADDKYVGVAHSDATIATHAVYFSALPTAIEDLKVLLYDDDNDKWAEYEVGNLTIPAGGSTSVNVTVKDADFETAYYAIDEASLLEALTNADGKATESNPVTIKLLGNIVLNNGTTAQLAKKHITVEGGKIIVSEGAKLEVLKATLKSDVDVMGESCCNGTGAGGLMVATTNAVIDGDITVYAGEGENKKDAKLLTGNAEYTPNSTVVVEGEVSVETGSTTLQGAMQVAEDAYVKVNGSGTLYFKGATLESNGTIEVMTAGKFNMLNANGTSTLADGANFTNNGKFIDNINAVVGAATQGMVNNGDYICRVADNVRLNEAYVNKKASNIIEFVNNVAYIYSLNSAQKHNDEYVQLVVNAKNNVMTTFKTNLAAKVEVGGVDAYTDLTIDKSDYKSGSTTTYGEIHVNGDIEMMEGADLMVSENVHSFKAENLYVNKKATATFENRSGYTGATMVVAGTIEVKKEGKFTIEAVTSADKTIALVTCTQLVEGGTFVGQPELVAAE